MPSAITPASLVKRPIINPGNKTVTRLNAKPTAAASFTPMLTTRRMLSVSFFPQYWAASISMAPSTPPMNICTTVCTCPPTYTPEMALSPSLPIIRLSAKPTAKVIRFCKEIGIARAISVL